MTTQLQSVEIHLPNGIVHSFEDAPVPPAKGPLKVKNGRITTIWHGAYTEQIIDGRSKIWRSKPTLLEALKGKGRCIHMSKDGSMSVRDEMTTFWGPPKKGPPTPGAIVHSHICHDGNRVFNDECDCFCETRIPLEEQRYSFWS
jgi:hypothetical protein